MCVQTVFFIPAGPSNLGMQTTLSENMEDDMERVSLAKELSSTTYPGRGIVIGRTKDGKKEAESIIRDSIKEMKKYGIRFYE